MKYVKFSNFHLHLLFFFRFVLKPDTIAQNKLYIILFNISEKQKYDLLWSQQKVITLYVLYVLVCGGCFLRFLPFLHSLFAARQCQQYIALRLTTIFNYVSIQEKHRL